MNAAVWSAKLEIQELLVRYATGIDQRDWALFRLCFTEDCDADYRPFGRWRSSAEITEWMISAHVAYDHTLHRITNAVIEVSGDTATCRSYVDVILRLRDGIGHHEGYGIYDDELVHGPEGWRIARRRYTLVKSGRDLQS